MPGKSYYEVFENSCLTNDVFSLTIECNEIAEKACAGQFIHIKCGNERLLRRPISICDVKDGSVKVVFEVKSEGTRWLSKRCRGDRLDILGPLGNSFEFPDGNIAVIGGGIGVPPMLFAAKSAKEQIKSAKGQVEAILGFRNTERIILKNEFEVLCDNVTITTDDGSFGYNGAVTAPLAELLENGDIDAVLACGPRAMLSAVASMCLQHSVPCQVSLEERMGCGVGACMVCSCATVVDGEEHMSRVCKDGPVFDAGIVAW